MVGGGDGRAFFSWPRTITKGLFIRTQRSTQKNHVSPYLYVYVHTPCLVLIAMFSRNRLL